MHSFPDKQNIFLELISLLSTILDLDKEGHLAHGLRVAGLFQAIAKQINVGNPDQLYVAGLLHDIGAMSLDNHVIHYAMDEFRDLEARNHPAWGAEILQSFYPFHFLVGWVADHHERFDGTGFPAGIGRR
ncbi:HD domain-containing protein [Methanococcoides sp. SA1]|nr:HD domain-containing protein [Methanococcoides sp. SA1]